MLADYFPAPRNDSALTRPRVRETATARRNQLCFCRFVVTEDQSAVIEFLSSPSAHGGQPVERIETHASIVFLAGPRALKLKRAVRYDYLDFSTVDRRRAMCEAEVRINRRTAAALYRGVLAITREPDGSLALAGSGPPVDWSIDMARFDQDDLCDRRAARGALPVELMPPLAAAIARLHLEAERRIDHGGADGMGWVIDGNAGGLAEHGRGWLDASSCEALTAAARAVLERQRLRLDARRDAGYVRQCHGDLHLRNIVLLDGSPTLFDAIEFNDDIACIDVLYDLAFLLMDLWRRGLPHHANAVLNGYLLGARDVAGLALLPLFLSCRAAVRAKTSATAAGLQGDASRKAELRRSTTEYLAMARRLLAPPPASLVAVGGVSGSGKSTLARAVAPLVGPAPGAVVLRSDEIRKQLLGVAPLERLGPDAYSVEMADRVYAEVAGRAMAILRTGHGVIADAVYARPGQRTAIEHAAAQAGVPFVGVWLEAPESALIARLRRRTQDASDADVEVARAQLATNPGPVSWHRVDASANADMVAQHTSAKLAKWQSAHTATRS
jgi:aminoglycoside phosphotransferase family enzyme/predicted kinase